MINRVGIQSYRISNRSISTSFKIQSNSILSNLPKPLPALPENQVVLNPFKHDDSNPNPTQSSLNRGYSPLNLPPKIDPIIDLFTNMLMKHGKKSQAQKRVSNILIMIQESSNQDPIEFLRQTIQSTSPSVKCISIRKSIKTTLSPRALDQRQRIHQSIAWILKAAESGRRSGISWDVRIAREILKIAEGDSIVYKWLEERHKQAALNRSNIKAR